MGFFSRKPPAEAEPAAEPPQAVQPPSPEPEPQPDAAATNPFEPDTDEFPADPTAASSEPPAPEPLRPLAAGAFLNGEVEIREVLIRGAVNFYLGEAGDWGSSSPRLVGERAVPAATVSAPEAALFPAAERFTQGDREYAVWPLEAIRPFTDWRAAANDETYLHTIGPLAAGLASLESAGAKPVLDPESLFINEVGQVIYYGFFNPASEENPATGVDQLAALSDLIMKTSLARGATLRLDDPLASLALSVEVKSFARALHNGEFSSAAAAAEALSGFLPVSRTDSALLTDVGMERELNEDCGLLLKLSLAGHTRNAEMELLAVADGMGGHEGGEVASDLALKALQNSVISRLTVDWNDNAAARAAWRDVLQEVNAAVVRMNEDPPYASLRNKPGATLVCALRLGSRLIIGNVGDSRAYRWNPESGLERLTKDHSYVQELIDAGRLDEEDAWGHPDSSVITSHIGLPRGGQQDVFLRLLRPNDKLFLVSDGVVDMLRDAEIEAIAAEAPDARSLCIALVTAANAAGGIDNITVAGMFCS